MGFTSTDFAKVALTSTPEIQSDFAVKAAAISGVTPLTQDRTFQV